MKRFFDCLASGVGLVVLSPVLLGIAIFIVVRDGSPALFIQDRVGKRGRIFRCIKFRTMRVGTPEQATHEVGTEPITPVGKVLRRTKLDELPQLWNVFTGDMSLV
ncbi:MAG: sugar transferase, partial [Pseudomonadota bacterium]